MFSITTLSGGEQVLMGQRPDIAEAIALAVDYGNEYLKDSEHHRKERDIRVSKVKSGDTIAPKNAIVGVHVWFPTVARSHKTFWIIN